MAVWQFVIDLIPASAARVAGVAAVRMSRAQLDETVLGFSSADAEVLFLKLGRLLPEKPSWSDGLRIWGDEKADDIQVSIDGQATFLKAGEAIVMPAGHPHAVSAPERFKMLLVVVFSTENP